MAPAMWWLMNFAAAARSVAAKPSFLILFADDMGYSQPSAVSDRSGFAGDNGTISTPAIDALAASGMSFTSWYSSFHVCSPSRASMMTGRLSVRAGIGYVGGGSNGVFTDLAVGGLPLNETTMAESLRSAGYATGMVGKWHLGQQPQFLPRARGFESYFGIPYSCDMGISAFAYSDDESHPPFAAVPLPLLRNDTIVEQPANLATLTRRYAEEAIAFTRGAKAADRPFLLYVAFNHVHSPNFRSERMCDVSRRGAVGDAAQELDGSVGTILAGVFDADTGFKEEDVLVFFTSDNGAPLRNDARGNGPLRDGKATTWEGGVRVPGAASWKGVIAPGSVSHAIVATYDIFSTVLALAGAQPPPVLVDGIDLSPLLRGESEVAHECVVHYHSAQDKTGQHGPSGVGAARCGRYKAHFYTTHSGGPDPPVPNGLHDPPVIFDLLLDLGESSPLDASSTVYADALVTIEAFLVEHLASVIPVPCQMHPTADCERNVLSTGCVGLNDATLGICLDPDSKATLPHWPNCTSTPEYYGTAACRDANKTCIARCMPQGER